MKIDILKLLINAMDFQEGRLVCLRRLRLKRVSIQVNRVCERFHMQKSKSRTEGIEKRDPDLRPLRGDVEAA